MTVAVFALLGLLVASTIAISMKGARKSEATIKVRESLDYALAIVERQIRNADDVISATALRVDYHDAEGVLAYFSCEGFPGPDAYLASGSATMRLTTPEAPLSDCSFTYTPGTATVPSRIQIDLDSGSVSVTTTIDLRAY
jgi:hypothetical protein